MITKTKTLRSVNANLDAQVLEVLWVTEIAEDGEVLTSKNERSSYGVQEKERFEAELGEDAAKFIGLLEWTIE